MVLKIAYKNILILLVSIISILHAQDLDSEFSEANQAYTEGDYQHAIELYSKILEKGIESGEVYFNLGNAYFKTNNPGRAILYYEKASKFIEGDPALEQNLQLSRLRIVDKIEPIPELFIFEWWTTLIHLFSLDTLLWVNIAVFSTLILLIIVNLLYGRQLIRQLIWVVSVFCLVIFVITFSLIYEFESTQFGVILEEKASVISEPDINGTEVFILHEGTKVKINRLLNNWLEITIPDGKTGWVKETSLEVI
jgi:tetratricopeptide (TPR) repeat protein